MRKALRAFAGGVAVVAACRATTARPYFLPVPSAATAEIELEIPEATRALAEALAVDSVALTTIKEPDGYIDSGWLDARTLEHTRARPLGQGVVRVRAWVNPSKQFWSELQIEATYRAMADPSRPERELDLPLPDDHPLQRRIAGVLRKLIVQYGDADALKEFETRPANKAMADSTAKADSIGADTLKVKPDTTKVKPDTLKARPDSTKPKRDTLPTD